jgi:pilus assembly protein CpaF
MTKHPRAARVSRAPDLASTLLRPALMSEQCKAEVFRGLELIGAVCLPRGVPATIGRAPGCEVPIEGRDVSRRHATVTPLEGGFELVVLSAAGVLADGRPAAGGRLPYGTRLALGSFEILVSSAAEEDRRDAELQLRRRLLGRLVEEIDLAAVEAGGRGLRPRVEAVLERLAHAEGVAPAELGPLIAALADEALGLGPLEGLLADPEVSEIMVVDPATVFAERRGRLALTGLRFTGAESVRAVIERIITPLGRRIDESSPMVDARLPDGSRVNVVIPPLAVKGPAITIRKFSGSPLRVEDLIRFGSLDEATAELLRQAVRARRNIVISGGTGSGKTTLLGALAGSIPAGERIVTIEDAAELRLEQPHVVVLEARPPNAEGRGQVTIRDLVRNALRMRPDRIVVGECRGGEALDMLQAMNTGHDGSMTTTHANSPAEAMARLETLCLMSGLDLPSRAIREQIGAAVDLVVQQTRFADGARRITCVAEVDGLELDGRVRLREVVRWVPSGNGGAPGRFEPTGWLPAFLCGGGR